MKVIALCVNVTDLDQGGFRKPEVCKKYPGSGWMPYLSQYASKEGFTVLSGTETQQAILRHEVELRDILVVQEELNVYAKSLIGLGARPGLLFCLESPLYAPFFYDVIPDLVDQFPAQILFDYGTHPLHFPSFDLKDIKTPIPIEKRKHYSRSCMVVSNKYYKMYEDMFSKSPVWHAAILSQLHDSRYAMIAELEKTGKFDLYGHGWPEGKGKSIPPGEKVNVLREYLINYCFENVYMTNYLTEKLFDCLIAGVVPIYLGAPNIDKLVPADVFGDVVYGDKKTDLTPHQLIANGQKFIRSKMARKYSYQGFAENVLNILKDVCNQSRGHKRNTRAQDEAHEDYLCPQLH